MTDYERYGDDKQQAKEPTSAGNTGTAIKFLLIGVGIGAATALLFAPMSGRDAREAIRHGCQTALDGISEQTRNLRQRGSKLLGFRRKA